MRFLIAALMLPAAFGAGVPERELQTECPVIASTPVPEFRGGYVFRFDAVLSACAPDGSFAFLAPLQLPGADEVMTYDVGVDPDGSFVVAAGGFSGGHVAIHGLVTLDAHGIQTGVIDTKEFWPAHVAVAEDHSIWVLGFKTQHRESPPRDYMILRKYSRDGKPAGSYLPRSSFPAGLEPGLTGSPTALMVTAGGIAVVGVSGVTSQHREIVRLDREGKELGRMPLDEAKAWVVKFALTSDGHLYGWRQARPELSILRFDVAAKTWTSIEPPRPSYTLFGADGDNLVYRNHLPDDGKVHVAWFAQPAE